MAQQKPTQFDIAVIGAGPGGYPAAIKAAQVGKRVALIEAGELGGTCLNRGCIPSKSLISSADLYNKIKKAERFGIHVEGVTVNYNEMVDHKDRTVQNVRKGLGQLIESNQITLFRGFGKFQSPREIKITGEDNVIIHAEKSIIATGSEPKEIPAFPFDRKKIHDSTSILEMRTLPKSIAIIGGGIIGCEFASLFQTLGVKITVIEMLPSIIPMECQSMSSQLTKIFEKKGIAIKTNTMVEGIETKGEGVAVRMAGGETVEADIALVAVGRQLNVQGIGLDKAGVKLTDTGLVKVNDRMETTVPGIYAIGDIASRWWLAHVASHQGLVAARNAAGEEAYMHYNAIPSVIFTEPEIGTVGYTLEKAIEEGYHATLGAFPFQALGKSQADLQTEGFAQIVVDKETGQVLGAQVIGHGAGTLVGEMGIVIANELTVECITETIHAHPTVAEVWLEAAMMASDTPLHLPPKRKREKAGAAG